MNRLLHFNSLVEPASSPRTLHTLNNIYESSLSREEKSMLLKSVNFDQRLIDELIKSL